MAMGAWQGHICKVHILFSPPTIPFGLMQGKRLPDTRFGDLPEGIEEGAYWKCLSGDGSPMSPPGDDGAQNLTGTVWMVVAPGLGLAPALLTKHTVREEDDGTISVRSGDGSSNSILVQMGNGKSYHGFIEHGVWS